MGDAWGIDDGYHDVAGQWHETPPDTRRALRMAMEGLGDVDDPPPAGRPVWFVGQGTAPPIERPADIVLEDGTEVVAHDAVPPDLPLGYHDLHPSDGGTVTRLIVVPPRCAPAPGPAWGWAVQLYAARSRASWGIGDLADLGAVGRWAAADGASFLVLSPLHAPLPGPSPEPSPYFASSRRWRNPLHLRIEDVDGFDGGDGELTDLAAGARRLDDDRVIDREAVWAAKRAALDAIWRRVGASVAADRRFDAFRADKGASLERYATFCALAEHHGGGWPTWPTEHRRPDSPAVGRFAAEHADAVTFHAWVQWLLDTQLASAAAVSPGFVHDLAIGADPHGADAWAWQDALANGVRVGAPPDEFNAAGQDWGLPPFVPWKLRAAGYEPLAELLRGAFEHAAGLRVDHVMGLFRLWWIPEGGGPADGGYVRFPGTELVDILALESARAGAHVVGEDLGTVEDEVREALAAREVLSYRLAWFEPEPPERWPERALAAVTTHDLPTLAGVGTGTDDEGGKLRSRLEAFLGGTVPDDPVDLAADTHRRLASSACRLVAATLDDALAVAEILEAENQSLRSGQQVAL
jgi:4-alpha-glucanotransferase